MASRINFKHWKNILISRLYEQFSRNDSEMAIALKYVIWKFEICNYFREIFKFRDFMNTLKKFREIRFCLYFWKI